MSTLDLLGTPLGLSHTSLAPTLWLFVYLPVPSCPSTICPCLLWGAQGKQPARCASPSVVTRSRALMTLSLWDSHCHPWSSLSKTRLPSMPIGACFHRELLFSVLRDLKVTLIAAPLACCLFPLLHLAFLHYNFASKSGSKKV